MALTLSAPQLVFDPPAGPPELEKPVTLRVGPIRFPDGQDVTQADVQKVGAFVYRGAPGSEEMWDESAGEWKPATTDLAQLAPLAPLPLTFKSGEPAPWQGLLVAAGQKDKSDAPRYAKAVGGVPRYRLRVFAHAKQGSAEHQALSDPSPDVLFVTASENQRFAVALDTGNARTAEGARLVLKNASLAEAGFVEIRSAGGQEVEIANCNTGGAVLARVLLAANGDIRLMPGPGGRVVLNGPLEAEQITYQPASGGPRDTLGD
jgi:hypothetical protein